MKKQEMDIADAINEVAKSHELETIVACGLGEFLIKEAVNEHGFDIIPMSERYGKELSKVFPAYAVARLVKEM
jgi:uncharacterized hydantoinase/oxoprolinase family protein